LAPAGRSWGICVATQQPGHGRAVRNIARQVSRHTRRGFFDSLRSEVEDSGCGESAPEDIAERIGRTGSE